jgi:hypothetical protein
VSTKPGQIVFVRTPCLTYVMAIERPRLRIAPFAAV